MAELLLMPSQMLEDDLALRIRYEVRRELSLRSRPGSFIYALCIAIVGGATGLVKQQPWPLVVSFLLMFALGLCRWRLTSNPRDSREWDKDFLWAGIGISALWGLFVCYVVLFSGISTAVFLCLLISTGLSAGATNVLSPDLLTLRYFQGFLMTPVVLITFFWDAPESFAIGMVCVLYALYLVGQGTALNRSFLASTESQIVLEIKTKQLELARSAAEEASRVKDDFLANVSHEIRTPINGVIGMTDEVLMTELSVSQREDLDVVKESAMSLLKIVNQILDFSRLEAGHLPAARYEEFSLDALLFDTLRSFSGEADRKALPLFYGISLDAPYGLIGDPGRLRQILTNLVGNALKFTHHGYIGVSVAQRRSGLEFRVVDTGIGISPDNLERLFEPFTQADSSLTRDHQGTGLGLSIARQLVNTLGGEISVESVPGQGSTFRFQCPSLRATQAVEQVLEHKNFVLFDNLEVRRQATENLLRRWGAEVSIGRPGAQVIGGHFLVESSALADFDLSQLSSENPVIVISRGGWKAEGFVDGLIVPGPFGARQILEVLETRSLVEAPEPAVVRTVVDPNALRILVVEDQLANKKLICRILERWGHETLVAANGEEAVRQFQAHAVDLILMDIQMPVMDGYQATSEIRNLEGGERVPIIAVTAHAVKGDIEKCLAVGMNAYVSKPLDRTRLRETIDSFFGSDQGELKMGAVV